MNNANKMLVNGKVYTVVSMSDRGADLRGPRGGAAILVKNIHSGKWVLIEGNSTRPRVYAVTQMEAAQ